MNEPAVLHERRGPAFCITINRPAHRNALNADVIDGVRAGYRAAQADRAVRAIVLTGAGDKAFCAGADLNTAFSLDPLQPNVEYADLLRTVHACSLPSIARVNGSCLAGGMGLLAGCDIAVAVDTAVFGLPEVRIGVFAMQVMPALQRVVPKRLVREWALTGEPFSAAEARSAGLVNHVVSRTELDAKVDGILEQIARTSPMASRHGRYAVQAMEDMTFHEGLAYAEAQIALLARLDDAREGLSAFKEKREPQWRCRSP
jgi:enoyl-CoA hydratase/carnithine racemase